MIICKRDGDIDFGADYPFKTTLAVSQRINAWTITDKNGNVFQMSVFCLMVQQKAFNTKPTLSRAVLLCV